MSRIATGTGDRGQTGLFDGKRVSKSHPIIRAFGDVDELDAALGIAVMAADRAITKKAIQTLQRELFAIKADLATPLQAEKQIKRLTKDGVMSLEKRIDELEASLPALTHFILNGGSACAAQLHVARAIARRAERTAWDAHEASGGINQEILVWLNRVSDYLFLLARKANRDAGVAEEELKLE